MIDATNLTNDLTTLAKDAAPMIQRLVKQADVNHDGTVTSAEFSEFLKQLTASIDAEAPHPASAGARGAATAAATPAPAVAGASCQGGASAPAAAALTSAVATTAKER